MDTAVDGFSWVRVVGLFTPIACGWFRWLLLSSSSPVLGLSTRF